MYQRDRTIYRESMPPTYSTARLDSLVCPVLVDSRALESQLPAQGALMLPQLPHIPEGRHPIIVEIWRVQDGMIEVGGYTADTLWELAGGGAGLGFGGSVGAAWGAGIGCAAGAANGAALGMWLGPLGWWCGATAGAAAGAAIGATMMGASGALQAAHWAAAAGRRTSETNSRVIGTYNEIIMMVPCRRMHSRGLADDFVFVLGAYTDSAASLLGEWLVGWGYQKSQAFGHAEDGALEVIAGPSGASLRVVSRQESMPAPPDVLSSAITSLSHPLLGVLPGERLMESFLDRSFSDQAVRVTPTSVRLEAGDAFLPGLGSVASDLKPFGRDDPWGALMVTGLPVRLSYPRAIED
jgi:hypothetical protein